MSAPKSTDALPEYSEEQPNISQNQPLVHRILRVYYRYDLNKETGRHLYRLEFVKVNQTTLIQDVIETIRGYYPDLNSNCLVFYSTTEIVSDHQLLVDDLFSDRDMGLSNEDVHWYWRDRCKKNEKRKEHIAWGIFLGILLVIAFFIYRGMSSS